ncbi:MAG TPA: hypothetical protein VFT38_15140 [Vicinamibacteria bacterium]|nr:hypothetical protein [Vicinamibacteria bacterium]
MKRRIRRPGLFLPAVAVAVALTVGSGSAHAAEIGIGYSGLRADGDLTHGGVLGVAFPRSGGRLRLVAELSAQSGEASGGERLRELGLLAGAAFAPWRAGRLSPFVSLKAGAVSAQRSVTVFGVSIAADGVCDGGCPYQTGPAVEVGGGLDLRVGGRWAVRLAQADYRVTRLGGETDHGLRLSAGIVRR